MGEVPGWGLKSQGTMLKEQQMAQLYPEEEERVLSSGNSPVLGSPLVELRWDRTKYRDHE
jgi:hypothetical protein